MAHWALKLATDASHRHQWRTQVVCFSARTGFPALTQHTKHGSRFGARGCFAWTMTATRVRPGFWPQWRVVCTASGLLRSFCAPKYTVSFAQQNPRSCSQVRFQTALQGEVLHEAERQTGLRFLASSALGPAAGVLSIALLGQGVLVNAAQSAALLAASGARKPHERRWTRPQFSCSERPPTLKQTFAELDAPRRSNCWRAVCEGLWAFGNSATHCEQTPLVWTNTRLQSRRARPEHTSLGNARRLCVFPAFKVPTLQTNLDLRTSHSFHNKQVN